MRDMAPKGKKGKKSSLKKHVLETSSEPEFLKQLDDWRMQKNITWGGYGVSKSWRSSVSKKCNSSNGSMPQLHISCANHNKIQVDQEHGESKPRDHSFLKIPFLPLGFYTSASKLSVWTPFGPFREWWANPCLYLSTSFCNSVHEYIPSAGIMVLTGLSRPALLFVRPHHQPPVQIESLDCTVLIDPYDSEKESIIFTNSIGSKGKFYVLSLHGALAVVEEVDSKLTITGFGKNRAIPSVPSRWFIEYLIESNGEILLVFLISKKSISMIDYVEVVKLDLVTLSWVKMENLGDRALFLAWTKRGMSVSANQVAYKRKQVSYKSNHVYFTQQQGLNCWKEFDMETKSISPYTL